MVCRTYSPEFIPDSALNCFNSGNKNFLAILTATLMRHVIDIDKNKILVQIPMYAPARYG